MWWPQGFVPEEDAAIKKAVADYKKASGNTIELSIIPFAPQRQKIVSAVTFIALYAWEQLPVERFASASA